MATQYRRAVVEIDMQLSGRDFEGVFDSAGIPVGTVDLSPTRERV
jgi:hypothetical protein